MNFYEGLKRTNFYLSRVSKNLIVYQGFESWGEKCQISGQYLQNYDCLAIEHCVSTYCLNTKIGCYVLIGSTSTISLYIQDFVSVYII